MAETTWNARLWVGTLCYMNVINYIDRISLASILDQVKNTFKIENGMAGFLQTVFVLFYVIFGALCGYLADHYNRKLIICVGMAIWSASILASSFIPSNYFMLFLLLRGVGGIGEAFYSVCTPGIVSDLFESQRRSQILMIIFFAIPIGGGLGYVYASKVTKIFGSWEWSLRITPLFGVIVVLFLILILREPESNVEMNGEPENDLTNLSYVENLKYLLRNKSYMWLCLAYPLMLFGVGAISWFGPTLFMEATCLARNISSLDYLEEDTKDEINSVFGAITMFTGIIGIVFGVWLTKMWKEGQYCFAKCATDKSDAYVAALGSFGAVPCLFSVCFFLPNHINISWIFFLVCFAFLCFNWAIVIDMLMYIVTPKHRNVATSWFLLLAHLLGDASGPFVVGLATDHLQDDNDDPLPTSFRAMLHAFYALNALFLLSGFAFLMAAYTAPPSQTLTENKRDESVLSAES